MWKLTWFLVRRIHTEKPIRTDVEFRHLWFRVRHYDLCAPCGKYWLLGIRLFCWTLPRGYDGFQQINVKPVTRRTLTNTDEFIMANADVLRTSNALRHCNTPLEKRKDTTTRLVRPRSAADRTHGVTERIPGVWRRTVTVNGSITFWLDAAFRFVLELVWFSNKTNTNSTPVDWTILFLRSEHHRVRIIFDRLFYVIIIVGEANNNNLEIGKKKSVSVLNSTLYY